jgi:hypothetical protein
MHDVQFWVITRVAHSDLFPPASQNTKALNDKNSVAKRRRNASVNHQMLFKTRTNDTEKKFPRSKNVHFCSRGERSKAPEKQINPIFKIFYRPIRLIE